MTGAEDQTVDPTRLVELIHDLRTPLAIVLGFSELLSSSEDTLSADQRREYVRRLAAAAQEMRGLLDAERSERNASPPQRGGREG